MIWNHKTGAWDTFPEVVHSPFLAFGGWQLGVPADSANQEAAWDFVAHGHQPRGFGSGHRDGELGREPLPVQPLRQPRRLVLDLQCRGSGLLPWCAARLARCAERRARPASAGFFSYTEVLEIELSKALAVKWNPRPRWMPSPPSGTV